MYLFFHSKNTSCICCRKFLFRFLTEARNRGMSLTDPTDVKFGNADPNELRNALRIAAEHQCEYVLVAHPDSSDELHGLSISQ